jgi:AraC-like DNA-binding protein
MLPTPHLDIPVPQPSASRDHRAPRRGRSCSPLPAWRLKRTFAHIEANLAETVTLADLAGAAGLTRMHFAAQFRAATGVRPHEFLLRRRIERSQELMQRTNDTLVEVALGVGFQTQAHFTTVFKRFVGETPQRWRRANAARAA